MGTIRMTCHTHTGLIGFEDLVCFLSLDVFIFADKTNNIYKAPPKQYKKLLKENVTRTYKKSTERLEKSIKKHSSKTRPG